MMNEQPEPCPKCASGLTSIQTRPGESQAYVECGVCGCRGPQPPRSDGRSVDVAAIDEWNVYARARRWADTAHVQTFPGVDFGEVDSSIRTVIRRLPDGTVEISEAAGGSWSS